MKRISLKVKGFEIVSNLYTKKALKKIIPLAEKILVDITDENITLLRQIYGEMEEIPDDRHNLVAWLNSDNQKEFTDLSGENLSVLLSEILNACEQTEGCSPAKIKIHLESEEDEVIEVKIFTKNQPNEEILEEEDFKYQSFPDSEIICIDSITKQFVNEKIFSDSLISRLLSREILTRNLIFQTKDDAKVFFAEIVNSFLNSFEGQVLYALSNEEHEIDFNKSIEDSSRLLNIVRDIAVNSDVNRTIKEKILTKILETGTINPMDENSPNYLNKRTIERMVSRRFSISWTFNSHDVEITATLANGTITFDKEVCPRCGRIVESELFTLPSGQQCCPNCVRNHSRVLGYHTQTISNVQDSCGSLPSEKARYGIELEMIRNSNLSSDDWFASWNNTIAPILYSEGNLGKLEHDGSLGSRGEEMISQPLNKEFILSEKMKKWIDACKTLYHSENSCGLHVHVDRTALTPKQWGGVLRFVANNYNRFVSAGIFRRTNGYNNLSGIKQLVEAYEDDETLFQHFLESSQHYYTISYSRHTGRTIEFRCFDSTVEYDQFIKNLKTIMVILDNAESLSSQTNIQIQV